MFPKAHAAAYVTSAFRIAWYKVHMPVYFYASWYSSKATDVDVISMIGGYDTIRKRIEEIDNKGKVHRTNAYNNWLFSFPAEEAEVYINALDVNWHEPVEMYIKYICKNGLDVQNFNKATIDVLFSLINLSLYCTRTSNVVNQS